MPARSIGSMVGIRRGPQFGAVPLPLTTGVDVSGVIDTVGGDVTDWSSGDEVTFYSLVTCGDCEFCRAGEVTVCPQHKIIGERMNGGLAEYVLVPARNLIAKPSNLTHTEVAALPVVSATAWHMLITRARLQAGETVFIPGAGGGRGVDGHPDREVCRRDRNSQHVDRGKDGESKGVGCGSCR